MCKKEKGEITVETTIVLTVILMIIGAMIYITLYVHDVTCLNAYAYGSLVEIGSKEECNEQEALLKINKTPVFVLGKKVSIKEDFNNCVASINYNARNSMKFISSFISLPRDSYEVTAVKKISYEKMCLYKAIKDGLNK